ncbi:MAG: hypothetical protein KGL94_05050 [Acidobacteriota bacterium]|nr:hypothetical protein [Acidobacteriota bacterium]
MGTRAEAEWLWSRIVGARIEEEPLRVVATGVPQGSARLIEAVELGRALRVLRDARLALDSARAV